MWLSIAALSVICACTPAAFASGRNHLRNRIDPRTAWAVADFNGDRRLDLITASSTRNLSGSYTYDIQVALGGPESGSLSFASADAHIRLQARDVDGDHDADLVVLGAISETPIDLWINDGAGHFHHGDASRLPTESKTASLEGSVPENDTLDTLSDDQNSLAAPRTALWAQDEVAGKAAVTLVQHFLSFDRANVRSRAPPLF